MIRRRSNLLATAVATLLGTLVLGLLTAAPVLAQSDPGRAREQYQRCKDLMAADKACQALVACEEGLRALDIGNLRRQTDQARAACVEQEQSRRAERRRERACPEGKERGPQTGGECCWPGQSVLEGACTGVPASCPDGWSVDAVTMACVRTPCPDGQVHADETHCCWPEQVWLAERDRCIGIPACPAGLEAEGEVCRVAVPDQDQDGLPDAEDDCPTIAEDLDRYEDGDGCPEFDNDGDGVCDALFAAGLDDAASFEELECGGSDGCPLEAEDRDDYEDGDGCPELDNDGDRIADADDLCPLEPGTVAHGGCAPPPDYTMQIVGWSLVGVGTVLSAAGAGLLIATIPERDELNNPTVSTERGDVVLSLSEVEARELEDSIELKETLAAVGLGAGVPLLVGGAVLLLVDAFGSGESGAQDEALVLSPALGDRGEGWLVLQGRF